MLASRGLVGALLASALLLAGCVVDPLTRSTATDAAQRGGFSETAVFPGPYRTDDVVSRPLAAGAYAIREPEVLTIGSPVDGVRLQVGLILPDVPEGTRVPVIATASPYLSPMTPARIKGEDQEGNVFPHVHLMHEIYAKSYVPHGYAFAMLAVRGTGGSGGCLDPLSPTEAADVDAFVTWLGTQAWSSGNVALVGLSYAGSTPWQAAALGNPHLKTIVPAAGLPDLHGFLYRNGTSNIGAFGYFAASYHAFGFALNNPTNGRAAEDTLAGLVCADAAHGTANGAATTATLARSAWWDARDHRPGVEANYRGSVLLVQGLEDWRVDPANQYPWVPSLEARGITLKQMIGQWGHNMPDSEAAGENRRWDWSEILLRWFDHWLKGDASVELGPRAQVQDASGRWRNEETWPPRDASAVPFHLAPGGKLSTEPAGAEASVLVSPETGGDLLYPDDPLPNTPSLTAPNSEPAVFETAPFERELRFAGLPTLHLAVTPKGPGGYVTALLYADEAGARRLVGRGQIDLRVADGSSEPKTVVPGAPLVARMQLEPLDVHLPAGARLVLALTQSTYGEKRPGPFLPLEVAIGGEASTLTLHAFERGPEAFFEPPQ